MSDAKVHDRFPAIPRDARRGDEENRQQPVMDCNDFDYFAAIAAYSTVERLKTCMVAENPPSHRLRPEGVEVTETTRQFRPKTRLLPARRASLIQPSSSVAYLGPVADRTNPRHGSGHKKVTSQMGATALRDLGKMLDMVTGSPAAASDGTFHAEVSEPKANCFKGRTISKFD
jgi:hypothetical protein